MIHVGLKLLILKFLSNVFVNGCFSILYCFRFWFYIARLFRVFILANVFLYKSIHTYKTNPWNCCRPVNISVQMSHTYMVTSYREIFRIVSINVSVWFQCGIGINQLTFARWKDPFVVKTAEIYSEMLNISSGSTFIILVYLFQIIAKHTQIIYALPLYLYQKDLNRFNEGILLITNKTYLHKCKGIGA